MLALAHYLGSTTTCVQVYVATTTRWSGSADAIYNSSKQQVTKTTTTISSVINVLFPYISYEDYESLQLSFTTGSRTNSSHLANRTNKKG